jgi:predicted GIY-YIG superfamily endonuclease
MYYVYILRCADDSYYVGSAQDRDARVNAHNDGRGAAYTFKHRPVHVVYSEALDSEVQAINAECQVVVLSGTDIAELYCGGESGSVIEQAVANELGLKTPLPVAKA